MSRLPHRRVGTRLEQGQREVPFTPFPLAGNTKRIDLQSVPITANPWDVARAAARLNAAPARLSEAEAFINQAEEFYRAATTVARANPLLIYYAFQNLAKALVIVMGHAGPLENAEDGITEESGCGAWDARNWNVVIEPGARQTIFRLLADALGRPAPVPGSVIAVADLLPQVVVGHRVYRSATGAPEQFAPIQDLQLMHDVMEKTVWIDLVFDSGRLGRTDVSSSKLMATGAVSAAFREVESNLPRRRRFEMLTPLSYDANPLEQFDRLVDAVRPLLWTSVSRVWPYRVHNVCLATSNRVPQVLSLYLVFFALGSVTRTRPHRFDQVLSEPVGSFIVDFISHQPEQLLYLMASEIAAREVVPGAAASPASAGRLDQDEVSGRARFYGSP
jgi:YaaC-like Protein